MGYYRRHRPTPEQKDLIYNAKSSIEAAELSGYSVTWCWKLRKELGIQPAHTPYTKDDVEELIALYRSSKLTIVEIAKKMGRSDSSVYRKLTSLRKRGRL